MKKKRPGGCLSYIGVALATLIAYVGWTEFLFKPIASALASPGRGLTWLIADLLSFHSETYGTPLVGYVFLISAALLLLMTLILVSRPVRWFLDYLEVAEAPVSILETDITLRLLDNEHKESEIQRIQTIHANRSDVNAYHQSTTATSGKVKKDEWNFESRIDTKLVTDHPLILYHPNKVEVIERFKEALPTSYRVTYLPNNLVLTIARLPYFSFFSKYLVKRETKVRMENEYNGNQPILELRAIRYPATNVSLKIVFPLETSPDADDIKCFLITENVAATVYMAKDETDTTRTYFAKVKSLKKNQAVRFQWSNNNLHALAPNPETES